MKSEEIRFESYIFCVNSKRDANRVSADSISSIFLTSLNKIGVLSNKIQASELNNIVVLNCRKPNRIDTTLVKSLVPENSNMVYLIPYISYKNEYHAYPERYDSYLRVMIFLVKDNRIIYSYYGSSLAGNRHINYDNYDERAKHTQEQWDELVKKVMQPYIDRLK